MSRVWDESKVDRDKWGRFADSESGMGVDTWIQRVGDEMRRTIDREQLGHQSGQWRVLTREQQRVTLAKQMFDGALDVQPDFDKTELRRLCLEEADNQMSSGQRDDITLTNGKATIRSSDPRVRLADLEAVAEQVDDLHARFPSQGRISIGVYPDNFPMSHEHADGQTIHGEAFIQIKARVWESEKTAADGFMPAQDDHSRWEYVLAHEWGHAIDHASPIDQLMAQFSEGSVGLSAYGQASPREAYAEAFAEWYLTKGHTTNNAALFYAEKFDWGEPW
jgi:hypothetical protein